MAGSQAPAISLTESISAGRAFFKVSVFWKELCVGEEGAGDWFSFITCHCHSRELVGKGNKRLMGCSAHPWHLWAPGAIVCWRWFGRAGNAAAPLPQSCLPLCQRHLRVHLKCFNHQTPFSQNGTQLSQSGPYVGVHSS